MSIGPEPSVIHCMLRWSKHQLRGEHGTGQVHEYWEGRDFSTQSSEGPELGLVEQL